MFWPGRLLIEQKSAGRDLKKAREQATDYFLSIKEHEKPRYILLSDFQKFELLDLEENKEIHFSLSKLSDNVKHFGFIAGYQQEKFRDQDPANIEASELMSNLHKHLEASGYLGHDLEILLVRIMFCLFAEDTGIFQIESLLRLIEDRTKEDGSDLGPLLIHLFDVLNTPIHNRQKNLDEDLSFFPYVNGQLFAGRIRVPSFDSAMRTAILKCCYFNWSKVSPALFGSLFQTVMLPSIQRQGGAHYTSEKNILKVIKPLFLDSLYVELEKYKRDRSTQKITKLHRFHDKISELTFFDPACGCGNFLILAFRELRELELEILKELYVESLKPDQKLQLVFNIEHLTKIRIDQFYGIEIEEFPARIAEAAMWLVDHQMNMKLSEVFGESFVRLPLTKTAQIHHTNALKIKWDDVLKPDKCSYILGNPPFVGKHLMNEEQNEEIKTIFQGVKGAGNLDYVSGWYLKSAVYMSNTSIRCALVSTNSITQGEQVSILWKILLSKYRIKINFAHRTFKWTIDEKKAKGMHVAAVFVVIIGFSHSDSTEKYIYEYEKVTSEPHKIKAKNINPYLVDAPNYLIKKRSKPICKVPLIRYGSKPVDNGLFIFNDQEKEIFLSEEPNAEKYIKPLVSNKELLHNINRWCLWLKDSNPSELRSMPSVIKRIEAVKEFRLTSKKLQTRKDAQRSSEFAEIRQPTTDYIVIPMHTSINREYIPFIFCNSDSIIHNSCTCIPNADLYHFGIISSKMHMVWVRYTSGRIKEDYRYSNTLVYNNFPWPDPKKSQKVNIKNNAKQIIDIRKKYSRSSLADIYDPNTIPSDLLKAHLELDRSVDKAYGKMKFQSDSERISLLFDLYSQLTKDKE